jgi:hypothetical protein
MKITGNNFSDDAYVMFSDGASVNFDKQFDALKLISFNDQVPQIYTVAPDNSDLAINVMPMPHGNATSIPLSFVAGADGDYTLTGENLSSFPGNTVITLEDLKTTQIQNLMQNPTYEFSALKADNSSRFVLHFSGPIGIDNQTAKEAVTIYSYGKTIYLTSLDPNSRNDVFVYNLLGQEFVHRSVTNSDQASINMSAYSGCYIVKLVTAKGTKSVKVVIP